MNVVGVRKVEKIKAMIREQVPEVVQRNIDAGWGPREVYYDHPDPFEKDPFLMALLRDWWWLESPQTLPVNAAVMKEDAA